MAGRLKYQSIHILSRKVEILGNFGTVTKQVGVAELKKHRKFKFTYVFSQTPPTNQTGGEIKK